MMALERCVHQVFKQGIISLPKDMRKEGHGNCATCTYDPLKNKSCKGYSSIKMHTFEVEEKNGTPKNIKSKLYAFCLKFYNPKKIAILK